MKHLAFIAASFVILLSFWIVGAKPVVFFSPASVLLMLFGVPLLLLSRYSPRDVRRLVYRREAENSSVRMNAVFLCSLLGLIQGCVEVISGISKYEYGAATLIFIITHLLVPVSYGLFGSIYYLTTSSGKSNNG